VFCSIHFVCFLFCILCVFVLLYVLCVFVLFCVLCVFVLYVLCVFVLFCILYFFIFLCIVCFCIFLCFVCFFIVFCIVSPSVHSSMFAISVQVYRPLPPGGNPKAVNKYHTISNHITSYHYTSDQTDPAADIKQMSANKAAGRDRKRKCMCVLSFTIHGNNRTAYSEVMSSL
jgi:hypothetical protein